MKKFLSLLLAMLLIVGLFAACGGTSTNSGSQPSGNSGTASTSPGTASSGGKTDTNSTSGSSAEAPAENPDAITDWVAYMDYGKRPNTLEVLYSTGNAADFLSNTADPLLTSNSYGAICPSVAKEWGTDDGGLTWKLTLRDDATWVDYQGNKKADVVAEDYLTSLEWVLNFWKNEGQQASTPCTFIEGAQDYYDYTKEMDQAAAEKLDLTKFKEMVKVEAPDSTHLVYHLIGKAPYFDSVLTSIFCYPLPVDYAASHTAAEIRAPKFDERWYCGPYRITSYVDGNESVLTKNDSWWGLKEGNTVFNTFTTRYVESQDVAYTMYQNGEIHEVSVTDAVVTSINANPGDPNYGKILNTTPYFTSRQMHFNYSKFKEDGSVDTNWNTAIANDAFRLSLYYGVDLTDCCAQNNSLDPLALQLNTYMVNNICFFSDGTDYGDYVKKMLTDGMGIDFSQSADRYVRTDPDKALKYKEQAMKELSEKGVTFPVEVDYFINASNNSQLNYAQCLKSAFLQYLGEDYVTFNIKTYVSSSSQEVYIPGYMSIWYSGWSGDYADPGAYLNEVNIHNDAAYYLNYDGLKKTDVVDPAVLALYEEYAKLCDAANAETNDLDKRYELFAKAEYFLLSHALQIPMQQNIDLNLSCANAYSKIHCAFGCVNFRYVNWETKAGGYTREEAEANYQKWLNG